MARINLTPGYIDSLLAKAKSESLNREELACLKRYTDALPKQLDQSETERVAGIQRILNLHSNIIISDSKVRYDQEDVSSFLKGQMPKEQRKNFVGELKTNPQLRKSCIESREKFSELEVNISAEAARAFNSGLSAIHSGNRNFPGHEWNSFGQRANELSFVQDRERLYAKAKESFEKLLTLGELEDLAVANLAIVEENIKNAPIAASFYPSGRHDHQEARLQQVREGKLSPQDFVFSKPTVPSDRSGNIPPTWRDGIPLRVQPDTRPIKELLELDFENPNNTRQLIRRLDELVPQGEQHLFSLFKCFKPFANEKKLINLMNRYPNFVDSLVAFIEQPLPGGNDSQLSKLNNSRIVAYRLLVMQYLESKDAKLLGQIRALFERELSKFRAKDTKGWETNWFLDAPKIIVHYADQNDELWKIISDVIQESSEVGLTKYFSGDLRLSKITEPMAQLEHRFKKDPQARALILDKLIPNDESTGADGLSPICAFPHTEKVATCLAHIDGTYNKNNYCKRSAIRILSNMDKDSLLTADPQICSKLTNLVNGELALRNEVITQSDLSARREAKNEIDSRLISLSLLLYSLDSTAGVEAIHKILDNCIKTREKIKSEDLQELIEFCRKNSIDTTRSKFEELYFSHYTPKFMSELRQWGTNDTRLAEVTLKYVSENSGEMIEDPWRWDAVCIHIARSSSFQVDPDANLNLGKDSSAWSELVAFGLDHSDNTKFVDLALEEPYQHLLTAPRIQTIVDKYSQGVLESAPRGMQHEDEKLKSLLDSLLTCAHLPETRADLINFVEQEIRKYTLVEAIEAKPQNSKLLYFLMKIHNKAMAMEVDEKDGDIGKPLRSWLFFSKEIHPPKEVAGLIFEYCLNDRVRDSVNSTAPYSTYPQMEAVRYADDIFNLCATSSLDRDKVEQEPLVSLADLETYLIQLTNGRKLPIQAVQAAYNYPLQYIGWEQPQNERASYGRKPIQALLELTKFPVLGLTAGGVHHKGPLAQGLSRQLLDLYPTLIENQKKLIFGEGEGQDPDLNVTFLLSALFRIREFSAIAILRDHPLEDRNLYAKIARFASMGVAEAKEDNDQESALEMCRILDEILNLVPDGLELEGMSKAEFRQIVQKDITELSATTSQQRKEKTDKAIAENQELAKQVESKVREKIQKARAGESIDFRLLRGSMQAKIISGKQIGHGFSFGSWYSDTGRALGYDVCQEIGERVCREMNFTIQELDQLQVNYKPSAADLDQVRRSFMHRPPPGS